MFDFGYTFLYAKSVPNRAELNDRTGRVYFISPSYLLPVFGIVFNYAQTNLVGILWNDMDCVFQFRPVLEVEGIPLAVVLERATQTLTPRNIVFQFHTLLYANPVPNRYRSQT